MTPEPNRVPDEIEQIRQNTKRMSPTMHKDDLLTLLSRIEELTEQLRKSEAGSAAMREELEWLAHGDLCECSHHVGVCCITEASIPSSAGKAISSDAGAAFVERLEKAEQLAAEWEFRSNETRDLSMKVIIRAEQSEKSCEYETKRADANFEEVEVQQLRASKAESRLAAKEKELEEAKEYYGHNVDKWHQLERERDEQRARADAAEKALREKA